MKKRTLEISLESNSNEGDGHNDETVVARVLELIQQGYTSGYEPTWCIKEEERVNLLKGEK